MKVSKSLFGFLTWKHAPHHSNKHMARSHRVLSVYDSSEQELSK